MSVVQLVRRRWSVWRGRRSRNLNVWDLIRDLTNAALHRFVDDSWQKLFSRVTTTAQHDERRRSAAPRRVDEECLMDGEESFALVRLESEQCKRFSWRRFCRNPAWIFSCFGKCFPFLALF